MRSREPFDSHAGWPPLTYGTKTEASGWVIIK